MLFEKLLDGITTIIEYTVRIVLFLLKALGLWIPAVYSLLFVLLCAIFKVNFSEVLAIYLVGLAVSFLFAFYIMFLRVMKRKKRRYMERQEKRASGKRRKNTDIKNDRNEQELEKIVEAQPQPVQSNVVDNTVAQPQTTTYVQPQPAQSTPNVMYQTYYNPASPIRQNVEPMDGYVPPQINEVPPQYVSPRQTSEPMMTSSRPIIFRTRTDPNLLIYEYSDRLVFYRKTLTGLEHVKTERKNPLR